MHGPTIAAAAIPGQRRRFNRKDAMLRKLVIVGLPVVGALLLASAASSRGMQELCFGSPATITGSGMIPGTDGADVIVGSDGNDVIQGRDGNDKLCGGAGDDEIGGGPGDDQIDGGPGNDNLLGGAGNDTIVGGDGDDTMQGGADTDGCDGGAGTNTAVTAGLEACETVSNASPPATPPTPTVFTLRATLTVKQVVPRPKGARAGGGVFTATLTPTGAGATLVWRLTFRRLTGKAVAAHIHRGTVGRAGGIVVRLCAPCRSGARGTAQVRGGGIPSGTAYVDVHTKKNPKGEIRGQISRLGP
jgi:Ca2+-binding RTX toxin-like protein